MGIDKHIARLIRPRATQQAPADADVEPLIADATKHGLVPDDQVSADEVLDAGLANAIAAAVNGHWQPVAALFADVGRNWDLRAHYARRVARATTKDDGWLHEWRTATSRAADAADAAVVYAEWLVAVAWEVRTAKRAAQVSSDQFATFHRILGDAQDAALYASSLAPDDPTPWVTLLTICRGLEHDAAHFESALSQLTTRAPDHRKGHEEALQYVCKKWFGSHEQMFDFAWKAAATAPSLRALPLIGAVEYWLEEDTSMFKTAEMQAAADAVLRDWLDGAGAASPTAITDRSLVATAYTFGGRGVAAVKQFRILGSRGDSWIWQYFGDPPKKFLQVRNLACIKADNAAQL
jgi:hypothetical protein